MRETVTVEMVSGYCVPSYISDKWCTASTVIRHFMVLLYVVSVIMEYTVSYGEISFLVNRSWHTVCSAV